MADEHWRNTANDVRIASIDARAFAPFPPLLVIKSMAILQAGIVFVVFFAVLEKKFKLNFAQFRRKVRVVITGNVKSVRRYR